MFGDGDCSSLTHSLLAHSTLVGVSGGLVMMRVRNQTSADPQQRERFDLQMGRVPE